MLGKFRTSNDRLYIPTLVHLKERATIINQTTQKSNLYHRYRLDWTMVEAQKVTNYKNWIEEQWNKESAVFPASLPQVYDHFITGLEFAIPKDYLHEIQYFTQLYIIDRSRHRPFDTIIRDMCQQTSIAAINCAFKLLADCVYDSSKLQFWRGGAMINEYGLNKWSLTSLLLYKFWSGVTGRGIVYQNAEFPKIEKYVESNDFQKHGEPVNKWCHIYDNVIKTIKDFEESQEHFWSLPMTEIEGESPNETEMKLD